MKFSQARQGRIFVLRLEDGEIIHEVIERFAEEHSIRAAALIAVGGADQGSRLVVGPEEGRSVPVVPMEFLLEMFMKLRELERFFPMKKVVRRFTCTAQWAGKTRQSPVVSAEE